MFTSKEKIKLQYHKPEFSPDKGRVVVRCLKEVIEEGIELWKDTIVGVLLEPLCLYPWPEITSKQYGLSEPLTGKVWGLDKFKPYPALLKTPMDCGFWCWVDEYLPFPCGNGPCTFDWPEEVWANIIAVNSKAKKYKTTPL
ncbi:hypothetical protein GIB67_015341 [Kingdonia uniflora]|uniref:Uncharacterized protein n=1 Tax=Kingdonia uniflora TaxID=39325 RepID=A0A7J7KYS7_9MAGN|nr:hypothetical protein GIB67_015341 [Kingdonia uniflora]